MSDLQVGWTIELYVYEQLLTYIRNNIPLTPIALEKSELTNQYTNELIRACRVDDNSLQIAEKYKNRFSMKAALYL